MPGQDPQHVQMKEANAFGDFRPGSHNRNDAQKERQRQQQQAQSIESEVEVDAKFGNPNPINLFEPSAGAAKGDLAGVSYPEEHDQREVEQRGSERNPPSKSGTPTGSHGRQHACAEKNDDEPRENHVNRITPIKTTAPAATAAAYQRRRPDSVRLRA